MLLCYAWTGWSRLLEASAASVFQLELISFSGNSHASTAPLAANYQGQPSLLCGPTPTSNP